MRPWTRGALALLAIATAAAITVDPADAAPAPVANQPVIVVLKAAPSAPAGTPARADAVRRSQAPVTAELSGARNVHQLSVVNAVTAKVTPQQEAALRANPNVAQVVPDAAIRVVPPTTVSAKPANSTSAAKPAGPGIAPPPPGACAPDGKVQLDPEALSVVHADSDVPGAKTARSLGATGAGVTIGDIAGSIDVNSPELIRPNGQHVITDYRDFTGEGSATESEDIESFLDDGIMAAQSRGVYDLADYGAHHLAQPCRIRLEGVAPGVKLTAYKVYAANDVTTTSAFLEAIDYAVNVDHVNVLNEEAGSFPMPDTSADLIKTANANAMAAGVTITVPSYDSGLTNTIWSPASQPGVISVGASTVFRSYAQSDQAGFGSIGATGWISDNISSLSSGGQTEQGRSIDVVAPGDLDWTICTDNAKIAPDCLNDAGKQSGVILEGGTSEAGPLVAGVAALVIQSYRATHGGASPAPSLVDSLITGTADDLDTPGAQQGAGLVDAYRAVAAARSVHTGDGAPAGVGSGVIANTDQLDAIGNPGSHKHFNVTLTNAGAGTETVHLHGRTLGQTRTVASESPKLSTSDASYVDSRGDTHSYLKLHFTVPPGTARLNGDIAWPSQNGSVVDLTLLDPLGRLAGYSLPQGSGNHGHTDVHDPTPGTWTAVISGTEATPEGPIAGYQGVVHFQASIASDVSFGSVSPRVVTIAPGHSARVSVTAKLPRRPGDLSASLVLAVPGAPDSSVPMSLRSLIPVRGGVGHFTADLRGGNGRGETPAQTFFYNVDVPTGKPALDVSTNLAGDNTDPYYAYLIDPNGQTKAQASNQLLVGVNGSNLTTVGGPGLHLHTIDPIAGRWTVLITFTNPVTGNRQSTPLRGVVSFAPTSAKVTGLPTGGTLPAGRSQVVAVTVHNTSTAPESYFLDARLNSSTTMALTSITPSQNLTLPLPVTTDELPVVTLPQWIVPTDTTGVLATANSTAPVVFDTQPFNGEPDLGSIANGNAATAQLNAPDITPGDWLLTPQPAVPNGSGASGVPNSTASFGMTVTTAAFDPAAQSPNGDLWRSTSGFAPVVVQPGQTTTLYLTMTPNAPAGSLVSGTLYLDDSSALSQNGLSPSGDQLLALPYHYTVR